MYWGKTNKLKFKYIKQNIQCFCLHCVQGLKLIRFQLKYELIYKYSKKKKTITKVEDYNSIIIQMYMQKYNIECINQENEHFN